MVDPLGAQDIEGRPDVLRRTLLAGMGHRPQTRRNSQPVGLGEEFGRIARLAGIEPHALDMVKKRPGLLEDLDGRFGRQMAQEAQDQGGGDTRSGVFLGSNQSADHRTDIDPPLGMCLGIEEDLGVAHPVGSRPGQIGRHQVREVIFGPGAPRRPGNRCRGRIGGLRTRRRP